MNKVMGEFRVTGSRGYRGHEPGTIFEAVIDRGAVRRAVNRGDIEYLREVQPVLQPGSFALPRDWLPPPDSPTPLQSTEAPRGASLVGEEA